MQSSNARKKAKDPARFLLWATRARAKKRGMEFSLEVEDIVVPSHCPVLGIELNTLATRAGLDHAPTVDRLDNTRGYVKDNICIISFRANAIKRDATLAELEAIVKYVRERQGHESL